MFICPEQCAAARAGLRLTQRQLAGAARLGPNAVTRFESGENADLVTVSAIQHALAAAGAFFVCGKDGEPGVGLRLDRKTIVP